jgi:D-xylose 1-dehydrogenase (NADP+, D-xylono-1,5-lactone-forming)
MKWGLLSTANINRAILEGARGTDEATVVAVASRDRSRAEQFAREHGIERAHGSYEALLEDPDVDAVYNPLPNSMHVPWSLRALEAGKHVLCEKPLTRRAAEVEGVFAAAERSGRLLAEAFMWRHHPQTLRLRELLDEGVIGRLRLIRTLFSFPIKHTEPPNIRLSPELDGGALMDVGCYCVSGARLVAGAEPERVAGEQVLNDGGVDIAFSGTLRFPGDVLAQFDCGFALPHRHDLEAIGEGGSLYLADPWHGRAPGIVLTRDGAVETIEVAPANPYSHELADFARAARGEAPPRFGLEDARAQARVLEALYASAESGSSVALEAPVA